MPDLPRTTIRIITAILKHQASLVFGDTASKEIADTVIGEDLQTRLDEWLAADQTARQLLEAAEQAHLYVQDPHNCPDAQLRQAFHDMRFDNLPSVQAALTELPRALDSHKLQTLLQQAFTRDLPNLTSAQHMDGARLYTDALLRSVGKLEKFISPILIQTVLDLKKGQHSQDDKLDQIISILRTWGGEDKASRSPTITQPGDLPPGSYIPFPRNAFFTGRVADLETLSNNLLLPSPLGEGPGVRSDVRSVVINQTITGMGGLGKTQLAVEFAYRYGHQFKGVHWLDLREAEALESQIAFCGSKMDLPAFPPTQPEQVLHTLNEWEQHGPRLLILDNFEDLASANQVLGTLRHSNLKLLITSRRADWSSNLGLQRLPLDEFSEAESLSFLRNYLPAERAADAELITLADHLGHLPLALELAARYLEKQPRLKIKDYLSQLEKALEHRSMQNWKAEHKSLTAHDLSLAQTFAQSWEQVKNPTTQNLFISLGYCAPNTPIPYEILDCALRDKKDVCDDCMSELFGLGLLKEGSLIHPLLTEYSRGFDVDNQYLKSFCKAITALAIQMTQTEDQSGNYSLYTPLLPHIRSIAEHTEKAGLEEAGTLWNEIGYHIKQLADYAGARAAYERALQIDEAAFGPDHPQVATGVNNLGNVLQALGDHAGARAAFERALQIFEAVLGEDHPNVATLVNNLGNVLQALGDHAGARLENKRNCVWSRASRCCCYRLVAGCD